jgi:NAD(P)-dependent dehydrogenase (short-subunit alcohol dehydrogenase family)
VTAPQSVGPLQGRRALLVGAGSGIGRAVADAFVGAGARVSIMERDPAKCDELQSTAQRFVVTRGDATSFADTATAVTATCDELGGIDVVVSFVGLFDYYLGLADLTDRQLDEGFDEAYRVNVKSLLITVKSALPHLVRSKGSIVLTASTSSFTAGRGGVLYVGAKFAVRGIVMALAHELAPDVRVNAVAPGGTLGTDLRGLQALGQAERSLGDTADREADVRARSPLNIAMSAADHAASYVFLASDGARGMTGRFLHPDGGAAIR